MTDALSESSLRDRSRQARAASYAALCSFLEDPSEANAGAMAATFASAEQALDRPFTPFDALFLGATVQLLRDRERGAWAPLLADLVDFGDPKLLNRFRAVSPFPDSSFVIQTRDRGRKALVAGEVAELIAALRDDTLVETYRLRIREDEGGADFLALRPLVLR
jgi:hypothetical protein